MMTLGDLFEQVAAPPHVETNYNSIGISGKVRDVETLTVSSLAPTVVPERRNSSSSILCCVPIKRRRKRVSLELEGVVDL